MNKYNRILLVVGVLVLSTLIYSPVALAESDGQKQERDESRVNITVEPQERGEGREGVHDEIRNQGNQGTTTATSTPREDHDRNEVKKGEKPEKQERHEKVGEKATSTPRVEDIEDDEFDGDEYSSTVGSSTQRLLHAVSEEKDEVRKEIRKIVAEQIIQKDEIAAKIDELKSRGAVKTFLVGSDVKKIDQLKEDMIKTSDHIDQLNGLAEKASTTEAKTVIQDQVKVLETEQQKIGDLLVAKAGKFSLFGWLVRLLNN